MSTTSPIPTAVSPLDSAEIAARLRLADTEHVTPPSMTEVVERLDRLAGTVAS